MNLRVALALSALVAAIVMCGMVLSGPSLIGRQALGALMLLSALFFFGVMGVRRMPTFKTGVLSIVSLVLAAMLIGGVSIFIIKVMGVIFLLFGTMMLMHMSNLGENHPAAQLGLMLFLIGILVLLV